MMDIRHVLTMAHIYHLEISYEETDFGTLTNIIHCLPQVRTLKIYSLLLSKPRELFIDEQRIFLASKEHKIRIVCLEKMIEMREVYYLMKLCPRMKYLRVNCINDIEVEVFVQDILYHIKKNCHKYLRLLCVRISQADGKIIKRLEEMIDSKKLLDQFKIERDFDRIYLQWGKND